MFVTPERFTMIYCVTRCWSKYCLDLLKTSKEQRILEMYAADDPAAVESSTLIEEHTHEEGTIYYTTTVSSHFEAPSLFNQTELAARRFRISIHTKLIYVKPISFSHLSCIFLFIGKTSNSLCRQ